VTFVKVLCLGLVVALCLNIGLVAYAIDLLRADVRHTRRQLDAVLAKLYGKEGVSRDD
jgi:hypothetical protein